jgi:hypothetical protein
VLSRVPKCEAPGAPIICGEIGFAELAHGPPAVITPEKIFKLLECSRWSHRSGSGTVRHVSRLPAELLAGLHLGHHALLGLHAAAGAHGLEHLAHLGVLAEEVVDLLHGGAGA